MPGKDFGSFLDDIIKEEAAKGEEATPERSTAIDDTRGAGVGLRAKLSLFRDPGGQGAEDFLVAKFGEANVGRDPQGNLLIRPPGEKDLIPIDEKGFSLKDLVDMIPEVLEFGAGTAGTAVGATMFPFSPVAGGALGASFGGGAAGLAKRGARELFGVEQFEPTSDTQAVLDIAIPMLTEGLGEAGGRLLTRGRAFGKRVLGPVAKGAEEARDIMEGLGQKFLPAQAAEGGITDFFHNVGEASILTGPGLERAVKKGETALTDYMVTFADTLGDSLVRMGARPEDIGDVAMMAFNREDHLKRTVGHAFYAKVDEMMGTNLDMKPLLRLISRDPSDAFEPKFFDTGASHILEVIGVSKRPVHGAMVDILGLKNIAKEELARMGQVPASLSRGLGRRLLKEVTEMPDTIPFSSAQLFRSEMLRALRDRGIAQQVNAEQSHRIMRMLSQKMTKSIKDAAKGLSPEAADALRTADMWWGQHSRKLGDRVLLQMIHRGHVDPESIGMALYQRGRPAKIRKLRLLLQPQEFKKVQSGFMNKMIEDSGTIDKPGFINGAKLESMLAERGKGSFGGRVLDALFPKGHTVALDNMRRFARTLDLVQNPTKTAAYTVAVRVGQISGTAEILSSAIGGTGIVQSIFPESDVGGWPRGAAILLTAGPVLLSYVMRSNRLTNIMLNEALRKPTVEGLFGGIARLNALLLKEGVQDQFHLMQRGQDIPDIRSPVAPVTMQELRKDPSQEMQKRLLDDEKRLEDFRRKLEKATQ